MLGSGEQYLAPFGILLNASPVLLSLLSTFPPLFNALAQLLSIRWADHTRSRRRFVVIGATIQSLVWLPIAVLALANLPHHLAAHLLVILACSYHALAGLVVPVWNSLIGDLIPNSIRGEFFGIRNQRVGLVTFITVVGCGLILDLSKRQSATELGFATVFIIAAIARLASARQLNQHDDPPLELKTDDYFSFWGFINRSPRSNYGRFVIFTSAMNFGVAVSIPYFTLYMLDELKLSYLHYMLVTAVSVLSQFYAAQNWGRLADRFGNKKILSASAIGLCLTPLPWLLGKSLWELCLIQVFSGTMWAGYNLATANFMFDAVTPTKRARCVAYRSIANGVTMLAGSLLGAYLATRLKSFRDGGLLGWLPSHLFIIFILSSFLRTASIVSFLSYFREVREVESIGNTALILRIANLPQLSGTTFSLLIGVFRKRTDLPGAGCDLQPKTPKDTS